MQHSTFSRPEARCGCLYLQNSSPTARTPPCPPARSSDPCEPEAAAADAELRHKGGLLPPMPVVQGLSDRRGWGGDTCVCGMWGHAWTPGAWCGATPHPSLCTPAPGWSPPNQTQPWCVPQHPTTGVGAHPTNPHPHPTSSPQDARRLLYNTLCAATPLPLLINSNTHPNRSTPHPNGSPQDGRHCHPRHAGIRGCHGRGGRSGG